jgi:SAM-dependent methyltransferase
MTSVGTRSRGTRSHGKRRAGRSAAPAGVRPFFADPVREYVQQVNGRPIAVLRAGCLTPVHELGLDELASSGAEFTITTADTDDPAVRRVADDETLLGDLRTAPLLPRTFDIVHCALLLERVHHVEVVLDRLAGALRPGGLLLLQFTDRDSAAGLLDRTLPRVVRRALWHRYHPGMPGPFRAVYEPTLSIRGIHGYTLMRGLVITARETARSQPTVSDRVTGLEQRACGLAAKATRGALPDDHDQLLYVIRKPTDRFARVV